MQKKIDHIDDLLEGKLGETEEGTDFPPCAFAVCQMQILPVLNGSFIF